MPKRNILPDLPALVLLSGIALFAFSLPLEGVDVGFIGFGRGLFSISKLAGLAVLGISLLFPKKCYSSPPVAFWCFLIYLHVFLVFGLMQGADFIGLVLSRFLTLCLLLWMLEVLYSTFLSIKAATVFLVFYLVGCIFLASIQFAKGMLVSNGRVSAEGLNPNVLANLLGLGLIILVGLIIDYRKHLGKVTTVAMIFTLLILGLAFVLSGSRGAAIALVVGLLVYLILAVVFREGLSREILVFRLKLTLYISFIGVAILLASLAYPPTRERWVTTLTTGSMTGREKIWPAAMEMVFESPLVGWGPVRHWYELGPRVGRSMRDTHNLYLSLFTEGGALGALPFLIGLALVFRGANTARRNHGILMPSGLFFTLLAINVGSTWQTQKLMWAVLAYVLAMGKRSELIREERRKGREVGYEGGRGGRRNTEVVMVRDSAQAGRA